MKPTYIPTPGETILVDPDFPLTKPDRKAVSNCTVKAEVIKADGTGAYVRICERSDIEKHGITVFVRPAALLSTQISIPQ